MIICLVFGVLLGCFGLHLGFIWRVTKPDVSGLLFLLRRLTRRGTQKWWMRGSLHRHP
jgi:hypothetical protein